MDQAGPAQARRAAGHLSATERGRAAAHGGAEGGDRTRVPRSAAARRGAAVRLPQGLRSAAGQASGQGPGGGGIALWAAADLFVFRALRGSADIAGSGPLSRWAAGQVGGHRRERGLVAGPALHALPLGGRAGVHRGLGDPAAQPPGTGPARRGLWHRRLPLPQRTPRHATLLLRYASGLEGRRVPEPGRRGAVYLTTCRTRLSAPEHGFRVQTGARTSRRPHHQHVRKHHQLLLAQ